MIKVGIIGGAGYTAGELLRLLVHHDQVEIVFVNSTSNAGNKITQVHAGLDGECDLVFTDQLPFDQIDQLFFCTAHGDTRKFMDSHEVPATLKIVDLSTDYRQESAEHGFVYGLPELNRARIQQAVRVANPGCFATAIQLGLLPLAANGLLTGELHTNAVTGSTGAGVKPSTTTHYSWRNDNVSIYKPFTHQHLTEIGQSITQLQPDYAMALNFIPVRGAFARGIFATTYMESTTPIEEIKSLYAAYYAEHPFTVVVDKAIDLKQVVNTNKCLVHVAQYGSKLLITTAIDNLLKGASGQAVQNMNLLWGLGERHGLNLKPTAF